ncbi:hypothetical protein CR194_06305 [Salipaludibacillus keqinensis]|uniref:Serine aminopeptidase S33 domain-containing protein n=1 Tax=Salipaludibacillus keqinensis TaxID=2045207 RepID=A0A323TRF6_9BACI|nr:alpha/beta hydrolase [Salipaludibacillus keqinensis]PYZ95123.1 hypothetical protein CR194_06305 [Salipaludibacillus keqinensis]
MSHITSLFTFSDKANIPYYEFPSERKTNKVLLCIHGITSELDQLFKMAELLRSEVSIDIHIPVLRGYTSFESGKGDLNEQGRYDLDLQEMIDELSKEYEEIFLLGHSMGAGNLLRYSLEQPSNHIVDIFLVSPFIHPSLDVFHDNNGDQKEGDYEIFFKRAAALSMLDRLNVHFFSYLPVVKIPLREIPYDETSTVKSYTLSFRLMMSRFIKDPSILNSAPLHFYRIFLGSQDEVISGLKFKKYWETEVGGDVYLASTHDHNSILTSSELINDLIRSVNKSFV